MEHDCAGPFEGPPTVKPPALPEDSYLWYIVPISPPEIFLYLAEIEHKTISQEVAAAQAQLAGYLPAARGKGRCRLPHPQFANVFQLCSISEVSDNYQRC